MRGFRDTLLWLAVIAATIGAIILTVQLTVPVG